jgi:hypothetical protein
MPGRTAAVVRAGPVGPARDDHEIGRRVPGLNHRGRDIGAHLRLRAAPPQPLAHPRVYRVDRRAGPAQCGHLRRRLAHPQRGEDLTGQSLVRTRQRRAQGEGVLGPHPVGHAHGAGRRPAQGGHDQRVRVAAVGVVDDLHAGAGGRGRLRGGAFERGHDQRRLAVGRQHQAGEALQGECVVAGQVSQVGTGRDEQRVEAGGGGAAAGRGEPRWRVQVVVDHAASLTVVWVCR